MFSCHRARAPPKPGARRGGAAKPASAGPCAVDVLVYRAFWRGQSAHEYWTWWPTLWVGLAGTSPQRPPQAAKPASAGR